MITLHQVAERAGVSLGTASAALNGRVSAKAATRERVERAAAELGYRKDASASVLAGKQRHSKKGQKQLTLGYVVSPGATDRGSQWEIFAAEAQRLGYEFEQVRLRDYGSLRRAQEHLHFLNIQGLYLSSPGSVPGRDWLEFNWGRFSVVKGFRVWPELSFPTIRHSAGDYMRMARDETIADGYRKIAFLLTSSEVPEDDETRLGAILAYGHLHLGREITFEWRPVESETQPLSAETARWLRRYRPDAVIAFASGCYHHLLNAGFRIPEDFGFASVIQSEDFALNYGVAGCDSRKQVFPEKAVQLLHRMVQVGDRGQMEEPTELVVEPRWLEGKSLPG